MAVGGGGRGTSGPDVFGHGAVLLQEPNGGLQIVQLTLRRLHFDVHVARSVLERRQPPFKLGHALFELVVRAESFRELVRLGIGSLKGTDSTV